MMFFLNFRKIFKHPKEKVGSITLSSRFLILFFLFCSILLVIFGLMIKSNVAQTRADFSSYFSALFFVLIISYLTAVVLGHSKKERHLLIYIIFLGVFIRILGAALVISFGMGYEGYLMGNAIRNDGIAWFNTYSKISLSDISYGFPGIEIFNTLCYKIFSSDAHRSLIPLIVLSLTGGVSAAFIFRFAKEFWREQIGKFAGFVAAITPEFAFHSWSHLREPILSLGLSIALFGLALIHQKKNIKGILVGFIGNAVVLSFHPGFGAGTTVIFLACFLLMKKETLKKSIMLFAMIMLLIIIGTNFAAKGLWKQFSAKSVFTGSYISEKVLRVSKGEKEKEFKGLSRSIFLKLPNVISIPAQIVYSTTLPYLPIGFYWSTWGFKIPLTIRALGWQIVLPFLILGIFYSFYKKRRDKIIFVLGLASISIISISAIMNMGELWDSTRYRSFGFPIFSCLIAYSMVKGWQKPKKLLLIFLFSLAANIGLIFMYKMTGHGDLLTTILEVVGLIIFFFAAFTVLRIICKNCSAKTKVHYQDSLLILFLLLISGILIVTIFFVREITGIGMSFISVGFLLLLSILSLSLRRTKLLKSF